MNAESDAAERYFSSIAAALNGLEVFLRDDRSPLYRHDIVASIVAEYISRLEKSFSCWRNRLDFQDSFRISRAESGFPGLPERAGAGKRPQAGRGAPRHHPAGR